MRHKALALIVSLVISSGCASHEAPTRDDRPSGAEQARRDIAAGHLELRTYGLVSPQDENFARLLQDRLGVQFTRVAGCAVAGEEVKQVEAYNKIMRAEIERRLGRGSIERLRAESEMNPPATRPAG